MTGLNSLEAKAARLLFPYFDKESVVFDIGSNKGFWADILIHNVSEMHLFEPNERLLTYTMVKYDYLTNVFYCDSAICNEQGKEIDFFYFTNQNNGLSNIVNNPKWKDLPEKRKKVVSGTIDNYFKAFLVEHIDMVKIDVEGADLLVLFGMEQLLTQKLVKFIQIENSEHIKLSGYTFQNAIEYMAALGYNCYDFDGERFIQIKEPTQSENLYFIIDSFTQDWNREFIQNTKGLKFNFALEIGCFEGLTTKYICENLLNEGGRIICVDPLTDEYLPGHPDNAMFKGQYDRFIRNTRTLPVELIRKKSRDVWGDLKDYLFDFIYVDGDHSANAVYEDAVMSLKLTKLNGFILFDDYTWRQETTNALDKFLSIHERYITVVHKGYQLMIQKTEHYA